MKETYSVYKMIKVLDCFFGFKNSFYSTRRDSCGSGETFSLRSNKFSEGITLPKSFNKCSIQVSGGILSNRFSIATDRHMTGEGRPGAAVSKYFKFIFET
jgi:hypothetical protein